MANVTRRKEPAELRRYGMTASDLEKSVDRSAELFFGDYALVADAMLDDAVRLLESHGVSKARQSINCARWVIANRWVRDATLKLIST